MARELPLLIRFVLAGHRIVNWVCEWTARLLRFESVLRDEFVWAWTPPNKRDHITQTIYGNAKNYLPGGQYYRSGLFPWEEQVLRMDVFPASGRLLLGGAGAGREIGPLLKKGYEILALDPCPEFIETIRKQDFEGGKLEVQLGSYADLVSAVQTQQGSLAAALNRKPIDLMILGWGSFSHVTHEKERENLLRSLRSLAPKAPVLLSFLRYDIVLRSLFDRLRPPLRWCFQRLGSPALASRGDMFHPKAGFIHLLTPQDIKGLADRTGYNVVYGDIAPYPHAILRPSK